MTAEERFWSKVDKRPGGCWLWTAGTFHFGHGQFRPGGSAQAVGAHVWSWERANGRKVPEGKCVLHTCDVPPCVRPDHLFLGTRGDNNDDRHRKGRTRTKLTPVVVLVCRQMYEAGEATMWELGKVLGVTGECIRAAIRGVTWQHLEHVTWGGEKL
jgi:hypothetical protein